MFHKSYFLCYKRKVFFKTLIRLSKYLLFACYAVMCYNNNASYKYVVYIVISAESSLISQKYMYNKEYHKFNINRVILNNTIHSFHSVTIAIK